jgi:hypothetical protein
MKREEESPAYKKVLAEFHAKQLELDAEHKAIYAKHKWGTKKFDDAIDALNKKKAPIYWHYTSLLDKLAPATEPDASDLREFAETMMESEADEDFSVPEKKLLELLSDGKTNLKGHEKAALALAKRMSEWTPEFKKLAAILRELTNRPTSLRSTGWSTWWSRTPVAASL